LSGPAKEKNHHCATLYMGTFKRTLKKHLRTEKVVCQSLEKRSEEKKNALGRNRPEQEGKVLNDKKWKSKKEINGDQIESALTRGGVHDLPEEPALRRWRHRLDRDPRFRIGTRRA
jgi:hypothetical protein